MTESNFPQGVRLKSKRKPHRCNREWPNLGASVGETPCDTCGWPICEHPVKDAPSFSPNFDQRNGIR